MENESILRPKITVQHIALTRGWINGLDLAGLADRYLSAFGDDDGSVDLRVAKTTLARVLQELANAAIRNGIAGASALFRQAHRIRTDARGPSSADNLSRPSFESFVEGLGQAQGFSHAELVASYNDHHPPVDTQHENAIARQTRLIERQLKLLSRLERLVSARLTLEDPVAGWFAPALTKRLEVAGFKTIRELVAAIAVNPSVWYSAAPGVGAAKARRIERFLRSHLGLSEDGLSGTGEPTRTEAPINHDLDRRSRIDLTELVAVQRVADQSPALPFLLPGKANLDGSLGRLRDQQNASAIEASNDYEAMKTWLRLKKSAVTVKLYEREITRLIAWSVQVRRRPMSSLSIEDALAYRDFLNAIPASIVIKKGPTKRSTQAQGELDKGRSIPVAGFTKTELSQSTIEKALVIVSGFFAWLLSVRYVTANPFVGVQAASGFVGVGMGSTEAADKVGITRARERRTDVLGRVLPREATAAIDRYLDHSPAPKDLDFVTRARFIFRFATMTGLRISEMAAARRDQLEFIDSDPSAGTEGGWILHVLGKRDKPREVPMPDRLVAELETYLGHRGLITLPCPSLAVDKGTFLIGGLPGHIAKMAASASAHLESETTSIPAGKTKTRKVKKPADGVRAQTLHLALKELFKITLTLSTGRFKDEKTAEKMRNASAHWLRHTLATRAVASGTPIDVIAGIFGHANIATTSIYIQAERHRKLSEMRKLWRSAPGTVTESTPDATVG